MSCDLPGETAGSQPSLASSRAGSHNYEEKGLIWASNSFLVAFRLIIVLQSVEGVPPDDGHGAFSLSPMRTFAVAGEMWFAPRARPGSRSGVWQTVCTSCKAC